MLTINPTGFRIKTSQNVFTNTSITIDHERARNQHKHLKQVISAKTFETVELPDIVYVANAGLLLRGLPEKVVLLSNMKYVSRKQETKHIKKILSSMKIRTFQFPFDEPFEGQGECKWFYGGKLLLLGYGFRSTVRTVVCLQEVLNKIYTSYHKIPPIVVGVQIINPTYYHLDIAMCEVSESECIVHKDAIDNLPLLRTMLKVHVITTSDPFMLNLLPLKDKIVTHKLQTLKDKHFLQKIFQRPVIEVDVSEFEKSGGSVRCLVLDV
jgi:N-dimethylarginine dimethylaminohydrolase